MIRHAVVDSATREVVNVVLWDGESEYDPGEGLELVELEEGSTVSAGDTLDA